jgi:methionyl-tRNA formyltransferase
VKIWFAGTPDFAVPVLEAVLRSRHAVALVVTQPDNPRGRGRKPWPPPVKKLALARGLLVSQPENINGPDSVARLRAVAADAFVVTAYGRRLYRGLLALPRLGCFNIHASLLPKYRGAAPIEHAILRGESETGITIQRMVPEIDAGPILARRVLRIGDEETAGELSSRLSALAAEMIVPSLDAVEAGTLEEQSQGTGGATFAPRLEKKDGLVPWQADARAVCNFIRAMTPWPGAFTFHRPASGASDPARPRPGQSRVEGEERGRLILLAARPVAEPGAGAAPGQIVRADSRLIAATGSGCVSVLRVKPEGGKPMDAAAYLRGRAVKPGDFFHGA